MFLFQGLSFAEYNRTAAPALTDKLFDQKTMDATLNNWLRTVTASQSDKEKIKDNVKYLLTSCTPEDKGKIKDLMDKTLVQTGIGAIGLRTLSAVGAEMRADNLSNFNSVEFASYLAFEKGSGADRKASSKEGNAAFFIKVPYATKIKTTTIYDVAPGKKRAMEFEELPPSAKKAKTQSSNERLLAIELKLATATSEGKPLVASDYFSIAKELSDIKKDQNLTPQLSGKLSRLESNNSGHLSAISAGANQSLAEYGIKGAKISSNLENGLFDITTNNGTVLASVKDFDIGKGIGRRSADLSWTDGDGSKRNLSLVEKAGTLKVNESIYQAPMDLAYEVSVPIGMMGPSSNESRDAEKVRMPVGNERRFSIKKGTEETANPS